MWRYSGLMPLVLLCGCQQYPTGGNIRLHLDMVTQDSFRPQHDPLPLAPGSIPTKGWEEPVSLTEAEARLTNPVAATPASLSAGGKLFGIYCTPCHGASGRGDGLVGLKTITKPANLTADKYKALKDGFFYAVLRNGSGLMPPQAESLYPAERWQIVNYIRKLQKP